MNDDHSRGLEQFCHPHAAVLSAPPLPPEIPDDFLFLYLCLFQNVILKFTLVCVSALSLLTAKQVAVGWL